VGGFDPTVAVRAEEAQVQAVADDHDDIHSSIITPNGRPSVSAPATFRPERSSPFRTPDGPLET
jgi:hypothetical protein